MTTTDRSEERYYSRENVAGSFYMRPNKRERSSNCLCVHMGNPGSDVEADERKNSG